MAEVQRDSLGRVVKGSAGLNPTGKNQWTARRRAEEAWELAALRGGQRKAAADKLVDVIWAQALEGCLVSQGRLLERLLPAKAEHHVEVERVDADALADRLAALAARRRSNGSAREPEPRGKNGSH